jgi:NADPH:quinone reductase-like Zn-dependent oxidoreductase
VIVLSSIYVDIWRIFMRAMVLHTAGQPLQLEERPIPTPGAQQLLIKVLACGVCRTDLHLVDGELPQARLPRVPGHEIVGEVTAVGAASSALDRPARRGAMAGVDLRRVQFCCRAGRTFATRRSSPVAIWTAVTPNTPWPTHAFACRFPTGSRTCRPRRCCVPA